jgi:hypothetical protein
VFLQRVHEILDFEIPLEIRPDPSFVGWIDAVLKPNSGEIEKSAILTGETYRVPLTA